MKRKKITLTTLPLIVCMLILLGAITAAAAIDASRIKSPEELVTIVRPENPGPLQEVTIRIENYLTDLMRANILWYINGELQEQGTGLTKFSFTTGSAGSKTRVSVTVNKIEGGSIKTSLVFRPADIDLLWEADTYVPNLYRGKALPSSEAFLRVVALPIFVTQAGALISPNELVYEWRQNRERLKDQSGVGKSAIFVTAGRLYGKTDVSVIVSSLNKTFEAEKKITINTVAPMLSIYIDSPILGTKYEKAIGKEFNLVETEVGLRAEPFYFSNKDLEDENVIFSWFLNNKSVDPNEDNPQLITLINPAPMEGGGISKIKLDIKNMKNLLQFVQKSFSIRFGATALF